MPKNTTAVRKVRERKRGLYFCRLCWQEFDVIEAHNTASATTRADCPNPWGTPEFAERINADCPGFITLGLKP